MPPAPMQAGAAPATLVVMGVSASGKSSVARGLAEALDRAWLDADDLHPPANVAKLSAGIPLTDADRAPWLDAVAAWIAELRAGGQRVVVACSALRRRYRDRLRIADPALGLVFLSPSRAALESRIRARRGHFMPASQLDDQLATLEPPGRDESAITIEPATDVKATVANIVGRLPAP